MSKKAIIMDGQTFFLIVGGLILIVIIFLSFFTSAGQRFWSFLGTGYDTTDINEIKSDCDTACFGEAVKSFCCSERLANFGEKDEKITCLDERLEVKCKYVNCTKVSC